MVESSAGGSMSTFIFSVLLNFSLASTSIPHNDTQFSCLDQATATKYKNDFRIDLKSFGGMELCNSSIDTKKLFNDLWIIEKGSFQSDNNHLLIKGFIPSDKYYSWMKSQTRGINRGDDIPYATAYNSGGYFTMQDGWALLSTLGRVGTVIHEARHTAGYSHTRCTFGPYANTNVSGCDRQYTDGGSHAVEMEYYARVSVLGSNFHPVYRAMARLMAMGRSNFVFNTSPIQKREGLLVQNNIGVFELYDGNKVVSREGNGEGLLKRTSFGASLFDGIKASAIEMYEFFQTPEVLEDMYSYFKLIKDDRGQGSGRLHDFEEIDVGTTRFVAILTDQGKWSTYNFAQGQFNSLQNAPAQVEAFSTVNGNGQGGLFARNKLQEVYQLNLQTRTWTPAGTWPQNLVTAIQWKNQILGLSLDGEVLLKNQSAWEPLPDFSGKFVRQMVTVPLYDGFEVQ